MQLDEELIASLDKEGDGVDKLEYVMGMLIALGANICGKRIDFEKDIQPLIEK